MKISLKADLTKFQRTLDWISARLESRDARERLDQGVLRRLVDSVAGVGGEEIAKLGAVTADGAGHLTIDVQIGSLLKDVVAALRALGFEFHEDPVVV